MAKKRIPVDIIVRSLQENMDESGRAELDSWLGQSGNRDIYEGLAGLWDDVRREASGYEPDGRRLWRRLQEHSGKSRTARHLLLGISAAAAVVLVVLSGLMLRYLPVGGPDPVVMSSVCGKSRNVLPDGTVVWLKDGSSLEYDAVSFGRKDRKVLLKGEAYFDVAKDADSPFIVRTPSDSYVTVYGTPWDGKHHLSSPIAVPLKAVCILRRDVSDHIEPIGKREAWPMLLQQAYRPADPAALSRVLTLLDRLAGQVSLYSLGCTMEQSAALVSYEGMNPEKRL